MTKTWQAAMAATMLTLLSSPAWAEPEEPYAEGLLEERPTAAPAPKRAVVKRVCRDCRSRFAIGVDASLGYMGFTSPLFIDRARGPVLHAALSMAWGRPSSTRIGLRLSGYFSALEGVYDKWFSSERETTPKLFGGAALIQAVFSNGLWIGKGLGVYHLRRDEDSKLTLPELVISAGWNIRLTGNLALMVNVEGGTTFYGFRGSANAGLRLSI